SRLTLHAADKAAQDEAAAIADDYGDDADTTIDDFDLAPCERDTRRRADCDVTYVMSDGSECDDTIHVRLSARGRIRVTSDSDDGDTQTFDDCTAPDDGTDDTVDDGADPQGAGGDAPADQQPVDAGPNLYPSPGP